MSEKKGAGRNIAIVIVTMCIILTAGLIGTIMGYASLLSEKDNIIASLNSQVSSLQDQVTDLQSQITNLQDLDVILRNQMAIINHTINLNGLGTVGISWFNAYYTSNGTKLGVAVAIVNNSSVPAENVSLIVNILFYNTISHNETLEYIEHSTNMTVEIERLDIGDWYILQRPTDRPEGEGWHFSVDFTLYADGVKVDHRSFGCYE